MVEGTLAFRRAVYRAAELLEAGNVRRRGAVLAKSQHASAGELAEIQLRKLKSLLLHAGAHTRFHADLDPAAVSAAVSVPALLGLCRTTTKSDVQTSAADLVSNASLGRRVAKTTGGSTAEPVTIQKTRSAFAWELAATWRGYSWAGVFPGDRQARFWGVPITSKGRLRAHLVDYACNRIRFSAFAFSDVELERYFRDVASDRPSHFYGYVSMLAQFADFVVRRGLQLPYRPRAIITTSEVLGPGDRELIGRAFGAPVFNEYGCGELGTIAHECPQGGMHLSEENMIIEVMKGDTPAADDEPGELVITELNNFAMPLIRYRTGDFATRRSARCSCGRTLAVLDGIHGRAYDFIVSSDGRRFHGEFVIYLFEQLKHAHPGIRQFQFEQVAAAVFVARLVLARLDAPDQDGIESAVRAFVASRIDPQAEIRIEYVESIPRERSGKLRVIKGMAQP